MISNIEQAANRVDSPQPTGSTSPVAAATFNTTQHGLRVESPVFPLIETEAAWQRHRKIYVSALEPVGPIEASMAEDAAVLNWRLIRATRFEVDTFTPDIQEVPTPANGEDSEAATSLRVVPKPQSLNAIARYEGFLRRSHRQVLADLTKLQDTRLGTKKRVKPSAQADEEVTEEAMDVVPSDNFAHRNGWLDQPAMQLVDHREALVSEALATIPQAVANSLAAPVAIPETPLNVSQAVPAPAPASAPAPAPASANAEPIERKLTRKARKDIERREREAEKRRKELERVAQNAQRPASQPISKNGCVPTGGFRMPAA